MKYPISYFKSDLPAGLIVFLVALPLCLGIALASGAPLLSAIVSGIIGGIVVGIFSQSHVSVSGPAAGLTAIVLAAISSLGSFELFLTAVVLAGLFQLILGLIRAGNISHYFPSSVIEGMLTGIGIIIILKQIPHATGLKMHPGAIIISITSLLILIAFKQISCLNKNKYLPAELIVVLVSITMNQYFIISNSILKIENNLLVQLPVIEHPEAIFSQLHYPDFSGLNNYQVWIIALTITIVASIESLFCLEASEKMDPLKRYASSNRELIAQGAGNLLSGFLGGLPMSSVIVRTSANVSSGAKTKLATIMHGIFLLLSLIFFSSQINQIPLASLAAILIMIGFKLSNPVVFIQMWRNGKNQFIPFIITLIGVVFTDLLTGVMMGMIVSVLFRKHLNV